MGSDVKSKFLFKWLIKFLLLPFCRAVIVKSDEMRRDLSYRRAIVIPNGVNTDDFQPMSSESAKMMLGWSKEKLHILFPSDPERPEKNFDLLLSGVKKSGIAHYEIHTMGVVPFHEMNTYYNASDLVCMTSTREGSPNAIKEAMACDKIIVSTEVGDVQWLFGSTDGLFLAAHDAVSYSEVLIRALNFSGSNGLKSKGRERILDLKMTSRQIAERIKAVYTAITLESNWSRKSL
jgi:teichuronic acid biosynthesis glycosyltransferase TuaC